MELYTYECAKCSVDNRHFVEYLPPRHVRVVSTGTATGPCLIVKCSVCGYSETKPSADQER